MKNVLVTGAAGFLGSHLCKRYLDAGDRVWGVDNFSSSFRDSRHLQDLRSYERFAFFEADVVEDWNAWLKSAREFTFDLIMNFACPASPPQYQAMPIQTMMTCTVGTANMLELAHSHGCRVVHASTSEVYGDPACSPQSEAYRGNVNPYGPRACYDEGKRAAEALCYDFLHKHGVDVRLVRIFNTYGPNMDPNDGRVVSNFICRALRGEPLAVYGDGRQTRSFCYVDDLVDGIVALGSRDENPGTPINLGNPNEFTVMELATRIHAKLDCKTAIYYEPLPVDDPTQRRPDITKARELLGWEPKVELEEGLSRTIRYFRSHER